MKYNFWIIIGLLLLSTVLIALIFWQMNDPAKNGLITGILVATSGIIIAMLSGWKKTPKDF